ncbi:MAG: hypothetical protein Q9157_006079 [Trypethelium eluteriae]
MRSTRKLGETTTLKHSGTQIKRWIDECNHGHKACRQHQNKKTFIPTRLLDISSHGAQRIRVAETKKERIASGPYVTLSHCWGTPWFTPTRLTRQNELEFTTDGVPLEDLPENFKQAIEIGRFLGVPYIWIDSLCIVQGEGGDFSQEATLMHHVYRNSYCNFAAADSKDGTGGLFRNRIFQGVLTTKYQARSSSLLFGDQPWIVIPEDFWVRELLSSHVYSRGWVFQERMLSPRLLHFVKHQIFWDCATMSACETFPSGLPGRVDEIAGADRYWRSGLQDPSSLRQQTLVGPADYSVEQFWKNAVLYYTSCNLTNGKDKLVAVWGVAKLIRDALGEKYGAGLWQRNLEEQLAWRVSSCELLERPPDLSNNPTWSWASINGAIQLQERLLEKERFYYVKDHEVRPLRFDVTDQIGFGSDNSSKDWAEEFQRMDRRIAAMKNSRESTIESVTQNHSKWIQTEKNLDKEPQLRSKSIQIQGHLVSVHLHHIVSESKWVPIFFDGDSQDSDGTLEVFPDLKLASDQSYLLLALVATRHARDESSVYDGIGIVLESAAADRHYHRL